MRRWRVPLTVLLMLFVLFDCVVGAHLWRSGLLKHVSITDVKPGVARIEVTPIAFTWLDRLILLVVIAFHAVLFHVGWRAWHASPVRP
jgi:hypothetical protein